MAPTATPDTLELQLLEAGDAPSTADFALSSTPHLSSRRPPRLMRLDDDSSSSRASDESSSSSSNVFFSGADTPSQLRQRAIRIRVVDRRFKEPSWMHPNIGGESRHVPAAAPDDVAAIRARLAAAKQNLGEWSATAISGNAILSSVLFSAGLTAAKAGKLAPVAQLAVIATVYGLRWVLGEVMSAVPLNGGCYTAVLNASSKKAAAVAATFSILSYLATGVVCGVSGLTYVNYLWHLPVVGCAVALLVVFALLCLLGIAESAIVALAFFVFHALTLTVLAAFCAVYAVRHPSIFIDNMLHTDLPDVTFFGGGGLVDGTALTAVFLGFAPALLSVTGFESSSQFVEEQAPGVFPKTLRNMWVLSSVFNIAFSFLSLAVVPLDDIVANKEVLLAYMGRQSSGHWLELLVTVDAFLVLSGAVLTSYVGINGLVQRLAIDRVLPAFLLAKNRWRGTHHFIILSYLAVASSLVVILDGRVDALSGVFGFAFMGVLTSFTVGCLLLKIQRDAIPRACATSWTNALLCLGMLVVGLVSNAAGDVNALKYFVLYYVGVGAVILLMLERVRLLRALLFVSRTLLLHFKHGVRTGGGSSQQSTATDATATVTGEDGESGDTISAVARGGGTAASTTSARRPVGFIGSVLVAKTIERIKKTPVIFFCKAPNLPKINEAIAYVLANEQTYCLYLVHMRETDAASPREFEDIVCLFDHIYPLLKIDYVSVAGAFEPATVEWLSGTMGVPTNMMFMRQPANLGIHAVSALGVRVITN